MRRRSINIICLILAFCIQNCIFPFIPFLSAAPNLVLIFVFTLSFIYGKEEGMIYGIIAGIMMDLFYSVPLGYFTLLFIWIAYLNGSLSVYFYENYIFLPLLNCTINEVIYNLYIYVFRFLVRGKYNFLYYFKNVMLPEIIITLLFTLLLYKAILYCNKRLEVLDHNRRKEVVR